MALSEPLVRVRVLTAFGQFLAGKGVELQSILSAVGLQRDDLADPDSYISLNTVAEMFELGARMSGDPAFGVHYAEIFPAGASGILGHIILTAPTVGEALEAAVQYFELLIFPMQPELVDSGEAFSLQVTVPSSFTAPQLHYMSFMMATVVHRIRIAAGPDWHPPSTEFKHRAPEAIEVYKRVFGREMQFNARRYRVDIDRATFAREMPQRIVGLFDSVRELGDRVLNEARLQQDVVHALSAALTQQLQEQAPFDLATVAGLTGMSPRALQWRLEQAGTSYERVLTRVRLEQATQLLRDTDLSIGDIAALLGYSEQSAFARAAQAWFKRSPSAQRQLLRFGEVDVEH